MQIGKTDKAKPTKPNPSNYPTKSNNYGFLCVCENRIFDILNTYYSSACVIQVTCRGEVELLLELLIWLKQSTPGSVGPLAMFR